MSLPRIHDKLGGHGQNGGESVNKDGNTENGSQQVKDIQILLTGQTTLHDQTDKEEEKHLETKDEKNARLV